MPGGVGCVVANSAGALPEGLAYCIDLPSHLAGPDGSEKSGLLDGTHNLQNAIDSLTGKNATHKLNPTGTNGIIDMEHQYTKASTGKLISGNKTVYDPSVFSDQTILDYSMHAGKTGWERYLAEPTQRAFDVTHGGVNLRTYVNTDIYGNNFISNVHPIK